MAESDSESDEDEALLRPIVPFIQALDGDSSEDDAAGSAGPATASAAVTEAAVSTAHESSSCVASVLPSADDFEQLAREGGAFLSVASGPSGAEEASWRLTPAQEAAAALEARRADLDAAANTSTFLPMNRYGRGLNLMQLSVELSGRAASSGTSARGGGASGGACGNKRKADDDARQSASSEQSGENGQRRGKRDQRGNPRTALEEGWT